MSNKVSYDLLHLRKEKFELFVMQVASDGEFVFIFDIKDKQGLAGKEKSNSFVTCNY